MNKKNLAVQVKQLLLTGANATLATQSIKHPGFPFASLTPYGLDSDGLPTLLLSSMATHSKNLKAEGKASLLVTGNGSLADGRASLVGTMKPVDSSELEAIKNLYLKKNPDASQWVSFGDFQFYKMEIVEIYFIAGFGSMGWIPAEDYLSSE